MMGVARASLLIFLWIYSLSLLPQDCSSQRPTTGVLLFLESGRDSLSGSIVANNSLLSSGNLSSDYGLACYSAEQSTNEIGRWLFPDGSRVERDTGDQQQLLYAHNQIGRVTLQIRDNRPFPSNLEGIYTCLIPDENSVLRTLYTGLYSTTTYDNSAGPILARAAEYQLLSHAYDYPPTFTVTCITRAFPPTRLEWTLNGSPLDLSSSHFSSSQQMRDASSSTYYNILTVSGASEGQYSCSVANDRGINSANLTVNGPSGAPTTVNVSPIGNNSVSVQWSPPAGPGLVRGYRVFYTDGSAANTLTIDSTAAVVRGLTLGVQYSITVQAFADFPSPNSTAATIMLNAPGTPNIVSVTPLSPSSLQVQWTSPTSGVNGYEVSYSLVEGVESCDGVPGGAVMVEGANTFTNMLTSLEAYTEYSVTVRARGSDGLGPPSTPGTGRTTADVPGPPQMVVVGSSSSGIVVSWREPNCSDVNDERVTGYQVRYGILSGTQKQTTPTITSGTMFTISGNSLLLFTDYSIEVAAVNSRGLGAFTQPKIGVITGEPGSISSLSTAPDILSVVLNWGHPRQGEGHITEYEIRHSLGTSLLGINRVSGDLTSYRVRGLQPDMEYRFEIRAFIETMGGPSDAVTARTLVVRQVRDVSVKQLNSSAVNVSWTRFDSEDVFYRVYYWNPPGQADFPGNSSWGVIHRLQPGQTQFQVAAVAVIQGIQTEGLRSDTACPDGACPGGNAGAIAGAVIATVIVLAMIIVFIIIYLMWNRGRSGKFEVTRRRSSALNLKSKHTMLPLPDFDSRPTITSAKPIIVKQPKDVIALEGEKVVITPEVAGIPPPSIAWYHDGGMVTPDYATEISDKGQLTFFCVEKKHAGVYRFTISNNAGSIQGQVSLFVRSEDDDVDTSGIPQIESNCISVADFGSYTEEQHGNSNRGFRDQYFSLGTGEEGHPVKCALTAENKLFNRFTNITVYDDNRVKLKAIGGRPDCHHDYINASYIDGYFLPKKFIATQGPTDKTVMDFWRLVWQVRAPTIVMITNLIEGTRVKCSQYWPERGAQEYGPFKVILKDQTVFADYTIRTFILILTTKTQPPLKVVQYHFTTWPDHGVPEYVSPMLAFHRRVNADHKSARGPMVVHCSAGVGRTGTFAAIDIALQQAEGEGTVDIPSILTKLRNQRMKMVQTVEQYVFIHDAVLESIVCGNTQIPADDFRSTFEALKQTKPDTSELGFQAQFNVLEQVTPKFDLALCPTAVHNEDKNRSMDYVPTDRWRVILKAEHPDYIHANFVNGYKQKKAFIITQGPMENTCRDFWKMVYERDCSSIVMLSGIIENEQEVCYRYWPQYGLQQYGEFSVSVMEESMHEGHLERVFSVTDSKSGQAHRVSQFQVFSWNPNGTTTNPRAIIGAITSSILLQKRNNSGPIVAHCSNTVIRSAMFCALAACIECCKTEGSIDVFQVVKVLRNQKPGAVPTLENFQNIYELLVYYLEEAGGLVDSSSMFQ